MTAIPAKAGFTDPSVTEGEFKNALEALHDYLTGLLGVAGTAPAAQAALGALLGAGVATRSADYTVLAADRGRVIDCTGTLTLSLTSAAALGAGFAIAVANSGTGMITIDPAASETVGDTETYVIGPAESALLVSTSARWLVFGNRVSSDGRGATGTWPISISGNAATATTAEAVGGVSNPVRADAYGTIGEYRAIEQGAGVTLTVGATYAGGNVGAGLGTWRCAGKTGTETRNSGDYSETFRTYLLQRIA